jgi:hypothetical protein
LSREARESALSNTTGSLAVSAAKRSGSETYTGQGAGFSGDATGAGQHFSTGVDAALCAPGSSAQHTPTSEHKTMPSDRLHSSGFLMSAMIEAKATLVQSAVLAQQPGGAAALATL